MTPMLWGAGVLVALLFLLGIGTPIAFALGFVSIAALILADGWGSLSILGETFFGGLASFGLVSIPMFILMGAAVASSPAGKDLYEALDRWLNRVPGGLVLSNLGACSIFAALSGSSPATCAAIGKMGIPEMTKRGYPNETAAGSIAAGGTLGILIPPSITMIVYGIATETSIGRLFLAGLLPGALLTALFMAWTIFDCRRRGIGLNALGRRFSFRERFAALPRVLPFLGIIAAILFVLYGGIATPSEAAGVGALFCLIFVAVIYRLWRLSLYNSLFRDTLKESVMIMMIIGASELFSFALSSLFITQTIAEWIAGLDVNAWVLMAIINVFLLFAGFFLPPVAVILMTAPILLPIIIQAGFDPYWFAVVLTINMEIGLITPPVGLNLYVINGIAPNITLGEILRGSLPYVGCMVAAIVLLCLMPGIALWLPNLVMGTAL
ncbi:TRAP transporter large permease [Stappia taiwanensis]|uniref:TRAP transporter large permease protein n=1 Tax=Stappia taiwanensis TaxID=992267 RepID=A0A838XLR5_9HYPH|nr:TRAP transporter large permease [Stappia taiwanensis]MBA4610787.1 TRAP transporter large permease [Stappia taiwanensis]GGE95857.1 C4-dicarboxylate ABC transporter [Stappia taiwanensis]